MKSSTPADGMIRFLDSVPNKGAARPAVERLVEALKSPGPDGLSYGEAMARSKLSSDEFVEVIYKGLSAGLLERFASNDEDHLRLTKTAQSLFPD